LYDLPFNKSSTNREVVEFVRKYKTVTGVCAETSDAIIARVGVLPLASDDCSDSRHHLL